LEHIYVLNHFRLNVSPSALLASIINDSMLTYGIPFHQYA